jgi:hypothetical protein
MNSTNTHQETCACGRSFSQPSAYTNHNKNCPKSKKRLSGALAAAKEAWELRKRRRVTQGETPTASIATKEVGLVIDNPIDVVLEQVRWILNLKTNPNAL